MKFSRKTAQHLGHYVYALIDPRDGEIFYVGKGNANNRAFDHLKSKEKNTDKERRIASIRKLGEEPRIEVLRYGIESEQACLDVEAAVIDSMGLENLTNSVRGHGIERGRKTVEQVELLHASEPVAVESIEESLMLFFINKTYSPTLSEQELYDSVRQFWSGVSKSTRADFNNHSHNYNTALAIVDSVVVRTYSIAGWFPAGSTYSSRTLSKPGNRWEFVGQLINNHVLVGKRLTKGGIDISANQQGYGYIN